MTTRGHRLHLVRTEREGPDAPALPERGDLALLTALLIVNLVPLVGELLHPGRWGPGTVGVAAACALLAGRELWQELRTLARFTGDR